MTARTLRPALLLLACAFLPCLRTQAQTPATAAPALNAADDAKIRAYIANGWETLSRSMSDCKSLVDPKVTTAPVLYLPAGFPVPAAVAAVQKQCGVQVKRLPRMIHQMGDVKPGELAVPGLLYLPNRYVVPGGRFNEMYGWDSYFILLGLVHDGKTELARGMVENFLFEIEHYGAVLNANRTYYFTRSQPPFLTSMIREVYDRPSDHPLDKAWLDRAYAGAVRDHALWTAPPHLAGNTGLARYEDVGAGPVPEMADDSNYYPDVIRWLLAHPGEARDYLVVAPDAPTPEQTAELAETSCDIQASAVCAHAHVEGHRLSAGFYRGDRAMRESGFDTSFRFGPFSGSTDHFAPICLNSLLFKYEKDLAWMATELGRPADAAKWRSAADARRAAIDKYLWNAKEGMYFDYDFVAGKQSTYRSITTFYPLWASAANDQQTPALLGHLVEFAKPGGLAMSTFESGTQWDLPFGWAPTNWIVTKGLAQSSAPGQAQAVAAAFSETVLKNFLLDGTIREKYNVVNGSANVKVAAGYKSNVVGFGWTNGTYVMMHDVLSQPAQ